MRYVINILHAIFYFKRNKKLITLKSGDVRAKISRINDNRKIIWLPKVLYSKLRNKLKVACNVSITHYALLLMEERDAILNENLNDNHFQACLTSHMAML